MADQDLGTLTMLGQATVSASMNAAHSLAVTAIGLATMTASGTAVRGFSTTMLGQATVTPPVLGLSMPLTSSMVADSSQGANGVVNYGVSGLAQGDSSFTSTANLALSLGATALADSTMTSALGGNYAVTAGLTSDSVVGANLIEFLSEISSIMADSSMAGTADLTKFLTTQCAGDSGFAIDPAGVVVVKITKGPGIPAMAKPPAVPQLRITPPAPSAPSYSVSTTPPRRTQR